MTTPYLDLDAVESPDEPSFVFKVDDREWMCRNRLRIPALVVDGLLGAFPMRIDAIYRGLLVEDQVDDFLALLARPDTPFDLARAQKLAESLAEVILNRPTQRPAVSRRGPLTTGGTSKAGSSSRGAPSKKRAG